MSYCDTRPHSFDRFSLFTFCHKRAFWSHARSGLPSRLNIAFKFSATSCTLSETAYQPYPLAYTLGSLKRRCSPTLGSPKVKGVKNPELAVRSHERRPPGAVLTVRTSEGDRDQCVIRFFSQTSMLPFTLSTPGPAYDGANFQRATVAFTNPDDTDTVVDLHNQNFLRLHDRNLFIRYGSFTNLNEPCPTIFVGGLSSDATEEQLHELLGKYAEIKSIRMSAC